MSYMKTKYFPPNIGNKAKISFLTVPIQHCTRSPSQDSKAIKRNKRHTDWKRRDKILYHRWHNCLYGHYKRGPRTDNSVRQGCKVHDQYAKINYIFICK